MSRLVELASDNFNRAALGANWTVQTGAYADLEIVSNALTATVALQDSADQWNAVTFSNDQFGQFTMISSSGTDRRSMAIMLRAAIPGTNSFYFLELIFNDASTTTSRIQKRIAGVDTTLASEAATTWTANDILRGEISGSGLRLLRNNSLLLSATDTDLATGAVGIHGYLDAITSSIVIDDWSAGNFFLFDGISTDYKWPMIASG